MSDIFISYTRDDRPTAETLAHALEAHGWSVWWDRTIPAGKTFDEVIEEALDAASCQLVLWSKKSAHSRWVRTEANEGAQRDILVPVLIEECTIPLAFRRIQAADLTAWDGEASYDDFQRLLADIAAIIGKPPGAAEEEPAPEEAEAEEPREEEPPEPVIPAQPEEPSLPPEPPEGARPEEEQPAAPQLGPAYEEPPEATAPYRRFPLPGRPAVWVAAAALVLAVMLYFVLRPSGMPEEEGPAEAPTATLSVEPEAVEPGGAATLTWETTGADEVSIEPGLGVVEASGTETVTPGADTTYTLVATGSGGTAEDRILLGVKEAPPPVEEPTAKVAEPPKRAEKPPPPAPSPTAEITATPTSIERGKQATLSWQTMAATKVTIEPGLGAVEASGLSKVSPETDTVYKLVATGPGGADEARVRVTVAERLRRAGEVFQDCPSCPEMVVIPAGTFTMGSPAAEAGRFDTEGPQHRVTIRRFALGKNEVTRAEFAAAGVEPKGCFVFDGKEWSQDSTKSWRDPGFIQTPGDPVVCVSWGDAKKYVEWLTRETGEQYRLPSESEWEYAARAERTTARYWGENPDQACGFANVADRTAKERYPALTVHDCTDGQVHTAPVGGFKPNGFGLYDVLGNVWEWVEDCWNDSYSGAPSDGAPRLDGDCSLRVLRGGSWYSNPRVVRSAFRGRYVTTYRDLSSGFRVARTLP